MGLYGQEPLLEELLPRLVGLRVERKPRLVRQEHRDDLPVVLLTGQHGAGKTAALDAVRESYGGLIPLARIDLPELCETVDWHQGGEPDPHVQLPNTSGVVEVLERLAAGLATPVPGYRTPHFPRLLPGLFAVSSWRLGFQSQRALAADRFSRLLPLVTSGSGERGEAWVAGVTEQLSNASDGQGLEPVVRLIVEQYAHRHMHGHERESVFAWYRQRPQAVSEEHGNPLVRLCLDFHQGGDLLAPVEETLVAALLEDLTEHYSGWWKRVNRVPRPLALLDDVHTEVGQVFLDRLLEHRRRQAEDQGGDPLVVLGTHLGEGEERFPHAGRREMRELAHGTAWERNGSDRPSAGVLRVPLPALEPGDLLTMLQRTARPSHAQLRTVIYRLTGGHPQAGRMLCDAVVASSDEHSVEPHELLDLHTGEPGTGEAEDAERTVGEHLLERLLPTLPTRHHLMALSLARDRVAAEALAAEGLMGEAPGGATGVIDAELARVVEAARYLEREQWTRPRGEHWNPAPSFVADPMLHALLVHETRRGSPTAETGRQWGDLHDFLRRYHEQRGESGDEIEALRHTLALGYAQGVVLRLTQLFCEDDGDARDFLAAMRHVATAPHPPVSEEWRDERVETARGLSDHRQPSASDVQRSVNRLLHALWYLEDPVREPLREVCSGVGTELDFLSLRHASGYTVLNSAAVSWPTAAWQGQRPYPVEGLD